MERSVVVTGCGSGIGKAIVERVVKEGYFAVGVERNAETAKKLTEQLGDSGSVVVADGRDAEALSHAVSTATASAPLTGWVNNVGVALGGMLHRADPADVEAVVQ